MNKSKIMLFLLVAIIAIISAIFLKNDDTNEEITQITDAKETKIALYFSNPDNGELIKEYRIVNMEDIKNDMPSTIINELLKGPENQELSSSIPSETKVNSILVENNKIIVDFSEEYKKESKDELNELHKIYSVVNSLTEITEINEVEIRVNGETVASKVRL